MKASEFPVDLDKVAALWQHGSVVRSWLLDLLVLALEGGPGPGGDRGYVDDSGEGRWTVFERDRRERPRARDHGVAVRAVRLAPGRVVRGESQRGAAPAVRRPRGEGRRREVSVRNPLAEGLRLPRTPDPCAIVIFGASGDLTRRKLFPAIYSLAVRDLLPERVRDRRRLPHGGDRRRVPGPDEGGCPRVRPRPDRREGLEAARRRNALHRRPTSPPTRGEDELVDAARRSSTRSAGRRATASSTSRSRRARSRRWSRRSAAAGASGRAGRA